MPSDLLGWVLAIKLPHHTQPVHKVGSTPNKVLGEPMPQKLPGVFSLTEDRHAILSPQLQHRLDPLFWRSAAAPQEMVLDGTRDVTLLLETAPQLLEGWVSTQVLIGFGHSPGQRLDKVPKQRAHS